jgi:hypothetical protein
MVTTVFSLMNTDRHKSVSKLQIPLAGADSTTERSPAAFLSQLIIILNKNKINKQI